MTVTSPRGLLSIDADVQRRDEVNHGWIWPRAEKAPALPTRPELELFLSVKSAN